MRILPFSSMLLTASLMSCGPSTVPVPASTAAQTLQAQSVSFDDLREIIQNVSGATARRFATTDNLGNVMDTVKIINDPSGGYLAVYHSLNSSNEFVLRLATSTNLLNWTYQQTMGTRQHQPDLQALPDGGFVLANEADTPGQGNYIMVRYYSSRADLLSNAAAKTYNVTRTLSACAEGTPSIYSVSLNPDIDNSTIVLGHHYYRNCDVDRQAQGTLTNFDSWTTAVQTDLNTSIEAFGLGGNIGDRDRITAQGTTYTLLEGQSVKNDFGTWSNYLWNESTATKLSINTPGGSGSFANPTITRVKSPAPSEGGQDAIVVTQFVPSENSAPGESGSLIYYRNLDANDLPVAATGAFSRVYQAEGAQLSHAVGRADGDGWSANTAQDGPGHMIFGPYVSDIPGGNRTAEFRLQEDNNTANNDEVVKLDIYDITANTVLNNSIVTRGQFSAANAYQDFNLTFGNTAGHLLEFRVYWLDKSYVKVDKITVF